MKIQLTYTQCKQIVNNGCDLRETVESLDCIPEWAHIDSISEIQSIIQCGCAANAHVSCYYAQAWEIFADNSNDIEDTLSEYLCEPLTFDPSTTSISEFVSNMLQMAVEFICNNFADTLNGVDWG